MYKNIEDKRAAGRKFYWNNREKLLKKGKLLDKNYRERNPKKVLSRNRLYRKNHPWMKSLFGIYKRVQGKESKERYYDRGIKNYLNPLLIKELWVRDRADKMKRPNIHRKNNNGDYTFSNCEFKDQSVHIKEHRKNGK